MTDDIPRITHATGCYDDEIAAYPVDSFALLHGFGEVDVRSGEGLQELRARSDFGP